MLARPTAPDRRLSLRTYLVVARALAGRVPFSAEDAFALVGEVRRALPIALPDLLSGDRLPALERAEDGGAYLDLLARHALDEVIARLAPVEGRAEP